MQGRSRPVSGSTLNVAGAHLRRFFCRTAKCDLTGFAILEFDPAKLLAVAVVDHATVGFPLTLLQLNAIC
jgi:hypothetical protein